MIVLTQDCNTIELMEFLRKNPLQDCLDHEVYDAFGYICAIVCKLRDDQCELLEEEDKQTWFKYDNMFRKYDHAGYYFYINGVYYSATF